MASPAQAGGGCELAAGRAALLAGAWGRSLGAADLRAALTDLVEFWLQQQAAELGITEDSGIAICAFGGLGRREMMPYSDLDLVLVHENLPEERMEEIACRLWYPLWDAGFAVDHSTRTIPQCISAAAGDLTVATSLLEVRTVAGDAELGALVRDSARRQWRQQVPSRFDELVGSVHARRQRAGIIANRMAPDLKNGSGGTRDAQLIDILAAAQLADRFPSPAPGTPAADIARARRLVLDARTELHRAAGKPREHLVADYGDEIARRLGRSDRFELVGDLSAASRAVAYTVDVQIRAARAALPTPRLSGLLRRQVVRAPLAEGVIAHSGEVALARDARPDADPGLVLRMAAASATSGNPLSAAALRRLVDKTPLLPEPWPQDALNDLLILLGAGDTVVDVVEELDAAGLWGRYFPEWARVRDLAAREPIHEFTVDRHLLQTVVEASRMLTEVSRPDLLLLAALLHDLGKGRERDHSEVGAELAREIAARMGLDEQSGRTLALVVRQHLLLAKTAAQSDPAERETAETVLAALERDPVALEILAALTVADTKATGPGLWTDWKARTHDVLVATCAAVLAETGEDIEVPVEVPPLAGEAAGSRALPVVRLRPMPGTRTVGVDVQVHESAESVSLLAAVLAAHGLEFVDADFDARNPSAMATPTVRGRIRARTRFGAPPDQELLRQDVRRSLDPGRSTGLAGGLKTALRRRVEATAGAVIDSPPPTSVRIARRPGEPGLVVAVRSRDRPGLLADLAATLARRGVHIDWATVRTRGQAVDDTFALRGPDGALDGVEAELTAVAARGWRVSSKS